MRDKGIRELVRAFSKLYRQYKHIRLFVVGGLEQKLDSLDEETLTLLQKHEARRNNYSVYSVLYDFIATADIGYNCW